MIAASNIFVLVALMLVIFMKSGPGQFLGGSGTVTGKVVGLNGVPQIATIYIMGTEISTETDGHGYFQLENVPGGEALLDRCNWYFRIRIPCECDLR